MPKMHKKTRRLLVSLACVIALALASRYLPAQTKQAQQIVTREQPGLYQISQFVDGDTIKVNMDNKEQTIRLIGVDTPEEFDKRKPVQCYAVAAAQHTKDLIGNQPVRLATDPLSDNHDRYDRLLRYVYTSGGTLVNQQIIADGYGFALTGFPFTKMQAFKDSQNQARTQNKGLWGKCKIDYPKGYPQTNPIAPAPKI